MDTTMRCNGCGHLTFLHPERALIRDGERVNTCLCSVITTAGRGLGRNGNTALCPCPRTRAEAEHEARERERVIYHGQGGRELAGAIA